MKRRFQIKLIRELDFKLISIVLLIFGYGLLILSSATHANITKDFTQIYKQVLAFALGSLGIVILILFDYNKIGNYYKLLYAISLFLLGITMIPGIGAVRGGARSWINLGPLDLQTSEIVKLTFILSYAKIIESYRGKLDSLKDILKAFSYGLPFILLLLAQPDLGTAIVFFCIIAAMMYVAGVNMKFVRRAFLIFILCMPLIYLTLDSHQKVRIDAFLHPENLELKGNYQVMQSLIAIGSGGITGKGIYHGSQNQENFLPVQDSDFIFAVIGEELGAIGMIAAIIMYAYFISRLVHIAKTSKNFYGTLVSIGVFGMFTYQIVQNIAMTVALMPVTGVTLPFISYGGSSLLTSLASVGLVLNVYMRRKKINF